MYNEALRAALRRAMLTERELAGKCQVNEKTVGRWIDGRTPHPRYRYAVAEALGADVDALWPDAIRKTLKTGADREVLTVYPRRADCPETVWKNLVTRADRDIAFFGYTSYFVWILVPGLRSVLRGKAASGCRVRFLLGDPASELTRRREQAEDVPLTVTTRIRMTLDELAKVGDVPGLEARVSDGHMGLSLFMFDNEMLVCPQLANFVGHESPMLHLARRQDGGLFDQFAHHVNWLWEGGRPVQPGRQSPQ